MALYKYVVGEILFWVKKVVVEVFLFSWRTHRYLQVKRVGMLLEFHISNILKSELVYLSVVYKAIK